MHCGNCLAETAELQELDAAGVCPRCATDYRAWRHGTRVYHPDPHHAYNTRTRKLVPTGAAYRDRLVAARLSLRSKA